MSLIRLHWISGLFKDRKRGGKRANQGAGCIGATSQVACGNYLGPGAGAIGQNSSGNQLHLYRPGLNAVSGSMIKIYEGRCGIASNGSYAGLASGLNIISHSFPLGLKARFGRSCRAFVNAWRGT